MDSSAQAQDEYTKARQGMIQEIEADVRLTSFYINKKELDPKVMDAMRRCRAMNLCLGKSVGKPTKTARCPSVMGKPSLSPTSSR